MSHKAEGGIIRHSASDVLFGNGALTRGDSVTLGPLKLSGGAQWHISLAPPRSPR